MKTPAPIFALALLITPLATLRSDPAPASVEQPASELKLTHKKNEDAAIVRVTLDDNQDVVDYQVLEHTHPAIAAFVAKKLKSQRTPEAQRARKPIPKVFDFQFSISPALPKNLGPVYLVADLEKKPIVKKSVVPNVPYEILGRGATGRVLLDLIISETGKVVYCRINQPSKNGFNACALDAAKDFKFQPGIKDGKPVACLYELPMTFTAPE